jgi:hypothetical protein
MLCSVYIYEPFGLKTFEKIYSGRSSSQTDQSDDFSQTYKQRPTKGKNQPRRNLRPLGLS